MGKERALVGTWAFEITGDGCVGAKYSGGGNGADPIDAIGCSGAIEANTSGKVFPVVMAVRAGSAGNLRVKLESLPFGMCAHR